MAVGSAFGALTELIGRLEATDREVVGVITEDIGTGNDDSLVVDLAVRTSLFDDIDTDGIELSARSASVNEDGMATVDIAVSIPRSIRVASTAPTNRDDSIEGNTRVSGRTAGRGGSGDVPVHRDPDRLREVYAACDTFTEMTEALGADVTSVTVRRNMIKHGIHEPRPGGSSARANDSEADESVGPKADFGNEVDADATANDVTDGDGDVDGSTDHTSPDGGDSATDRSPADDSTPRDNAPDDDAGATLNDEPVTAEETPSEPIEQVVAVPDGIGFPHDMTLDRLIEVVGTSKTLHEAGTRLELDRDRTRELLGDLGVLDLVHGRVSTRHERVASPKEIDERIREHLSRTT